MKKIKFIILISIFTSCGVYNKNEQMSFIQITDKHGISEIISSKEKLLKYQDVNFETEPQPYKQVTRIFSDKTTKQKFSKITSYHNNGNIFQYLDIKDSSAYGKYIEWHKNGQKKIEAKIIGGEANLSPQSQETWVFHDISFVWDEKGNLLAEINYTNGLLSNISSYYFPNGNLQKIIPYENNEIHGTIKEYDENKKLTSISNFKNGKLNGKTKGFYKNNYIFIENYKNGKLINGKYLDPNKKLISSIKNGKGYKIHVNEAISEVQKIEYTKGIEEGQIEIYSLDLQLICKYHKKNNQKQLDEIFYFLKSELDEDSIMTNEQHPKVSIQWKDNYIHGLVKTWYNNAVLESQKTVSKNKKNGPLSAWYKDGAIMLLEDYENDILIQGKYFKKNIPTPISIVTNGTGVATLYDENGLFIKKIKYEKGIAQ